MIRKSTNITLEIVDRLRCCCCDVVSLWNPKSQYFFASAHSHVWMFLIDCDFLINRFFFLNRIFQENFARQQLFFDALQRQAQYNSGAGAYAGGGSYAGTHGSGSYGGHGSGLYSGSKYGSGGSYAPNYAFASGSTGGGKHYGSASVYPSNSVGIFCTRFRSSDNH